LRKTFGISQEKKRRWLISLRLSFYLSPAPLVLMSYVALPLWGQALPFLIWKILLLATIFCLWVP
jgi:hypothetical protein